jgi:DNA replication protein DnaC
METQLLLKAYLKRLRLPAMYAEFERFAKEAAETNLPYDRFLLALVEQEILQRDERRVRDKIKHARFPYLKTLDTYDFTAIPTLNKQLVLQLAQGAYLDKAENIIFIGNAGTGKTHLGIGLGVAACKSSKNVRYFSASGLVNAFREALAEHRLSRFEKTLDRLDVVILDELGYLTLSREDGQLLFNFFAARYERKSVIVTSNLEFSHWTEIFAGDERLTGALLDRLTHHAHIIAMNGPSYRFRESQGNGGGPA